MTGIDGTPVERLKDAITSPYDTEDSDFEALIQAIATEFESIEDAREDVEEAKFFNDATGAQLERLASLIPATKRGDERDDEFRQRMKALLRSQLASATHDEVVELTAVLLDTDQSIIEINEQVINESPSFTVDLPVGAVGTQNLNTAALNPLLDEVSAVGVRPTSRIIVPDATLIVGVEGTSVSEITNRSDAFTASFSGAPTQTESLNNNGLSSDLLEPLSHSPSGFVLSGGSGTSAQITIVVDDTRSLIPTQTPDFEPTITASETENTTRSAKGLSSSELESLSQTGWSMSNA